MQQNNVVPINKNSITIGEEIVHIQDFTIQSYELATYLLNKEPVSEAFVELINAALMMVRLSNVSAETEALSAVAEKVRESVEQAGENTVDDITALLKSHTDIKNPGGLAIVLKEQISKLMIAELNPSNKNGPMYPIFQNMNQILEKVTEKVGIDKAENKSNKKGADFNKVMHGIVAQIGSGSDHQVEYTNDVLSPVGKRVGDSVVTIPEYLVGQDALRIVWEYKAERNLSLPSITKELEEAIQNREAQAGVFVLAREPEYENWPSEQGFSGNRMVIVVDKDLPDIYLVRYAYLWAKIMSVKNLAVDKQEVDMEKVLHQLDQAKLTLKDFRNVSVAHNKMGVALSDAQKWAKNIEGKLQEQFAAIENTTKGNDGFDEIVAQLKKPKKS
jgi:hypothetical protein